jgi:hypothetical protein
METEGHIVPCNSCGTPTTFATEIAPLGAEPGHRVYRCLACKRFTWIDWRPQARSSPSSAFALAQPTQPPARAVPQQQQQQQQQQRQSGAKSDEEP